MLSQHGRAARVVRAVRPRLPSPLAEDVPGRILHSQQVTARCQRVETVRSWQWALVARPETRSVRPAFPRSLAAGRQQSAPACESQRFSRARRACRAPRLRVVFCIACLRESCASRGRTGTVTAVRSLRTLRVNNRYSKSHVKRHLCCPHCTCECFLTH